MIINFGSINIDYVYRVSEMPAPGETLSAKSFERFLGGKGINQSIAIQKSGGEVAHVGAVGPDGDWVCGKIKEHGIALDLVTQVEASTGHAVIMVDDAGENQIVIFSGANLELTFDQIDGVLRSFEGEDNWILLQNETNLTAEIAMKAKVKGFKVAYAAAPFEAEAAWEMIGAIDLLAVNEIEAKQLSDHLGVALDEKIIPDVLITKGAAGAEFRSKGSVITQAAYKVAPTDTTGAGDTFLGYALAGIDAGLPLDQALRRASAAAAIQVTRPGAAEAIPQAREVADFLADRA